MLNAIASKDSCISSIVADMLCNPSIEMGGTEVVQIFKGLNDEFEADFISFPFGDKLHWMYIGTRKKWYIGEFEFSTDEILNRLNS